MPKQNNSIFALLVGLLTIALLAPPARASFTVGEYLYDPAGIVNPSGLAAEVSMTLTGSVLQITLKNTSADGINAASSPADALLTGLGFVLPSGVSILSGSAQVGPSSIANFSTGMLSSGANISVEWGYGDGGGGHFDDALSGTVNAVVTAMQADADTVFLTATNANNLDGPKVLNGPQGGALSSNATGDFSSQGHVLDTILITLNLSGSSAALGATLDTIMAGPIIATFGSPDGGSTYVPDPGPDPGPVVPEPASVAIWTICGLVGLIGCAWRRRRS